jgi:hypothetical protein
MELFYIAFDLSSLISANVLSFHIVHECFIDDPVAPRSGIIAREIPVSGIGRA